MTNEAANELVSARIIEAPCNLVFQACTEPARLAEWWGPEGFTNTIHEFDLRPGGAWKFTMQGPDGTNYRNSMVFTEIVPLQKIVLDHISGPQFRLTALFENLNRSTRLTFRQAFRSASELEKARTYGARGNEQNLDRLEDLLAKLQHEGRR